MNENSRDIIEYIIAFISEFADKFGMTEPQAFNYIQQNKGISFIEKHYNVIHTLSFADAVENVALYCRRMGGEPLK